MSAQESPSLLKTRKQVSRAIDTGKLNDGLQIIHDFVERIITEPLCTGHVNGSKELDILCQQIGELNLSAVTNGLIQDKVREKNNAVFVYIVTKIQPSGGHSLILERFISARPDANHIILSTELNGKSNVSHLLNNLSTITDVAFEPSATGHFQETLTWLQKRLIEISPEHIYLFNSHQDSVAIAAIQPKMALHASFYHHADHHLCLGLFLPGVEHIDIHPMGYHHCRDALGIQNTYLPLTTDDKGMRSSEHSFKPNGLLTTCTAGRANKIESPYFISYLTFLPQLLKATGGKHIHIGRLTPWALFRLRRRLKKQGISSDRLIYIPWVPSVWKALHDFKVDLYITSFPYGGGLTLIEAMGAGVPVAIHRHIYSRVLSGVDLDYPSAFSWQDPDEVIQYCSTVSTDELQKHAKNGRQQYEKCYHRDIFNAVLKKSIESPIPAPLFPYAIKTDEWACWMANQISLKKLIRRTAYRFFKRVRRSCSAFFKISATVR